jgi:long-chain acyl-CoA synthetase
MTSVHRLSFESAGAFTLTELLEQRTTETPDAPAITSPAGSLTYRSWLAAAKNLSVGLQQAADVAAGDRVMIWINNGDAPWFVSAFHAALNAGAIVVPVDDRLSGSEARGLIQDLAPRAIIVSATVLQDLTLQGRTDLGIDLAEIDTQANHTFLIPLEDNALRPIRASGYELLPTGPLIADSPAVHRRPDDCAFLAFTSGSTGRPKGAMISPGGSVQLAERMTNAVFAAPRGGKSMGPEDSLQSPIPAYLATSIANNLYPSVFAGCPLSYGHRRFDPAWSEQQMVAGRTTVYNGAPAHFAMMCQLPAGETTYAAHVDVMIMSGSPLTTDLYQSIRARWPRTAVANWYALNETMVGQTLNWGAVLEADPTSVGRPIWPTELRIAASDDSDVPSGEIGEILLRSPGQMQAYYNNPHETAARMTDGWIRTGDLGRIDPSDLMLRITGRTQERINRGAFKFYPAEVEEALIAHPAVVDVAVVGVPHSMLGQDVVAFVVLRSGESITVAELKGFSRERLGRHKIPSEFIMLDSLPRNDFGKLSRKGLVAMWEANRSVSNTTAVEET